LTLVKCAGIQELTGPVAGGRTVLVGAGDRKPRGLRPSGRHADGWTLWTEVRPPEGTWRKIPLQEVETTARSCGQNLNGLVTLGL
jgi:hypothetical protein